MSSGRRPGVVWDSPSIVLTSMPTRSYIRNGLPLHGTLAIPRFRSQEVAPITGSTAPDRKERAVGVLRLAHVDVRTPDLELSAAYYTEVLGLSITERTD